MGNFFSSPQSKAYQSLYDAAMNGKPVGSVLFQDIFNKGVNTIHGTTSQRTGTMAGDIMSRLSSTGVPGTAEEGTISKATQPILANEVSAISSLSASESAQIMNTLMQQLSIGLSGLSSSSTFGDIFSGLTTAANIGQGIATMGGQNGFGWWNKPNTTK
jgi:hypothetical protein